MKYSLTGKKLLAALLSAILLFSTVSCGSGTASTDTDTSVNQTDTDVVAQTSEPDILDGLNYNGTDFSILSSDTDISSHYMIQGSGEMNGDLVNDAVYERNVAVEDGLGVVFQYTTTNYNHTQVAAAMETLVLSGDASYDLVIDDQLGLATASIERLLYDVTGISTMDLSEACWSSDYMINFSIDSQAIHLMAGDYFIDVLNHAHALLYNRDMYNDLYGDPDAVYEMVLEGRWTYDELNKLIEGAYSDENGDGEKDADDIYGMIIGGIGGSIFPFTYSTPLHFISRDDEGYPMVAAISEQLVSLYEDVRLTFHGDATRTSYKENGADLHAKFMENGSLFVSGTQLGDFGIFRDMDAAVGILPYPKMDTQQDQYVTCIHDTAELGVFPVTIEDPEMSGAVVQMLNRVSHESLLPVYYETALKVKYARDDYSAGMIDMIRDGISDMFAQIYGNYSTNAMAWVFLTCLQKNADSIASEYATRQAAAEAGIISLIETYKSVEG